MKIIIAVTGKAESIRGCLIDTIEVFQKSGDIIVEVILIEEISNQLEKEILLFKLPISIYSISDIKDNQDFNIHSYCESLNAQQMLFIVDDDFEDEYIHLEELLT